MEADLLRWYQVDLLDLWRGTLSFRRLALLISHLPSESWTQTALRDEAEASTDPDSLPTEGELEKGPQKFGPWGLENYQLADLADQIKALRYVVAKTAGAKDYPEPKPTPRPGLHRSVRRQGAAGIALLKKLRNRQET